METEKQQQQKKKKLVFAVNGQRFEVSTIEDPSITLLEFLRTRTRFTGPKLGCGEGGCGACVVLLSKYDPVTEQVEEHTVNSCLSLLCSIHGCSITTSEGLGNVKDGFHSIHQRFSGFHATQCGFCTPGMCMSLFSALVNAEKTRRPDPPPGFSKLTVSEAEEAVAGNLCRCTGYRSIVDVCKSYASDVDIEDLGINSFWNKEGKTDSNVDKLPPYKHNDICSFPEFLKDEIKLAASETESECLTDRRWHNATSIKEVENLLESIEGSGNRVKLVAGNTGSGIYKEHDLYDKYIDLRGIPELLAIKRDIKGIEIGAAVTISKVIEALTEGKESLYETSENSVFAKIAYHLGKVASLSVRNIASLGGNLILSHRNQFPSDVATILLAADACVNIHNSSKKLQLTLEEFFNSPCDQKFLLLSIYIPCWNPISKTSYQNNDSNECTHVKGNELLFETYRAAPRPLGNAVSYLNAAFLAHVSRMSDGFLLESSQLAFGAYGTTHAIRAREVEGFLAGKVVTVPILLEAMRLLRGTVVPKEGTKDPAYRSSLAVGFLFDFLGPLVKELVVPLRDLQMKISNGDANAVSNGYFKNSENKSALGLSAKQVFEVRGEYLPVGKPTQKVGAEIQASGEAIYVDDIPSPKDCLHGAFICSKRPFARIRSIEFKPTSASQKISSVISVKDVPKGGKNVGSWCMFGSEPLFADNVTLFAGQPLGFVNVGDARENPHIERNHHASPNRIMQSGKHVNAHMLSITIRGDRMHNVVISGDIDGGHVKEELKARQQSHLVRNPDDVTKVPAPKDTTIAETQKYADMAASQAVVDYDVDNLEPPILTVEDAVERSSFFEVPEFLRPAPVGDFSKGMAEADRKILSAEVVKSQGTSIYGRIDEIYESNLQTKSKDGNLLRLEGSQYFFYMETQTALAVPDEDNCLVVYSSCQCPEHAHLVIADCLGIPHHNVRVITRRVGGGFGGKSSKALPVAVACALAAYKLRRPVRTYLDRKTDMILAGGRHPMKLKYAVGFKSDGKITALHTNILINAGVSVDLSPILPHNMVATLKRYNWGALSFDIKLCKTNHSSKTAMRGPGEVQASFIAEAVIEHVASALSVQPDFVRKKNLHTFDSLKVFYKDSVGNFADYTLPSVFDKLADSSSFQHRSEEIKQFNSCNKWKKHGISRVPVVIELALWATPGRVSILNDGSVVVEVGGIELGQGLWTKVKQMAAYVLNQLWNDGSLDILNRVRVIQADTLSMVQGGITASSTTSEASCGAIQLACNVLVERLTPVKKRLEKQMHDLSWDMLIKMVEVDLITGATTILRTDIIYDCGQSLNPAVDIGQVEGAFVQGVGFFMSEEYETNSDGLVVSQGTWTYKVPTIDTIPKQFNVEILNSGHHEHRILSSKASGEPPLLLAVSVHCATREAIKAAREEYLDSGLDGPSSAFLLKVPATLPVVKELCGLDNVEKYLEKLLPQ
ncbi:aryl-alcohol oxidase 3 [Asimina triloba]